MVVEALLGGEQAWTPSFYLRSFDMDSVQVGKAVFVKESYTILGIEPRTYFNPGRSGNHYSVQLIENVLTSGLCTALDFDELPQPFSSRKASATFCCKESTGSPINIQPARKALKEG